MNKLDPTTPDIGAGRKASALGSILRIPLRCGGKNGRCGKATLVPTDAFANPAHLRTVLETGGWGLITYGIVQQGQAIPLIDPACPDCYELYEEQQVKVAAEKLAAEAAAAALDAGEKSVVNAATGIEEPAGLPEGVPVSG